MGSKRRDNRPPSTGGCEKEVLVGFLEYLRHCVQLKLEGAPEPDVRTPGVPSGTNCLGLVNHLAHVERFMFLGQDADWPATFTATADQTVASVSADYRDAVARANEAIAACVDLAQPCARPARAGDPPSMRWALTHMIEETARHAGHLDILREQIDGAAGR
ncbi:DinB family protein [Mycobacterium sp. smrl_JER01]|uniref:DinB family protein n=1 Tax=Mycobacterium sp. smrl_JER01 TaxID=3402633 RepID=UPI003AC53AB7